MVFRREVADQFRVVIARPLECCSGCSLKSWLPEGTVQDLVHATLQESPEDGSKN